VDDALALIRHQEIDGFGEGLFSVRDQMDLPKWAHRVEIGVEN
jgi:hypothetical protein